MELFLLILCVLVTAADGNSAVKINVKEDSDVVLPCSLSSKENLASKLFDWKKVTDIEVFMYDAGRTYGNGFTGQDKEFEGRVSHFPRELENGNASIKITKTKVSDSGNYSCDFPRLQPSQTFRVELVVECILKDRRGDKGSVACRKPLAEQIKVSNDQALLQCVVEGASPKPEVEWRDGSGNILQAEKTKEENSAGLYNIILQTTVTKSDNYSCVAIQKEICHQVPDRILVYLPDPAPEPSDPGPPVGWIIAVLAVVILAVVVIVVGGVIGYRKIQGKNQTIQGQKHALKELQDQMQALQEHTQPPYSGVL